MSVKRLKQCKVPPDRIASAPYNFVPLPEKVVVAAEDPNDLPSHNCYYQKKDGQNKPLHTGFFVVTMETKSPLYVRAALTRKEFDESEKEIGQSGASNYDFTKNPKNKADFFSRKPRSVRDANAYPPDYRPVIPGSSLRGMIRQMLEVVSYSKLERVDNKRFFFRSVDKTSLGNEYSKVMKKANVCGGFLQKQDGRYSIVPCKVLAVMQEDIGGKSALFHGDKVQNLPNWNGSGFTQHKPIWVNMEKSENEIQPGNISDKNEGDGWQEARMVLTGDMPSKKREFVFLLPEANQRTVYVSKEKVIDLLHNENQISKWQEDAFPQGRPYNGAREQNGLLMKEQINWNEPVFFTATTNNVGEMKAVFIGRAQMFRVPYDFVIHDFIPDNLQRIETVDFADAVFGYITQKVSNARQGDISHAYASRINVTDAIYSSEGEVKWLNNNQTTVPPILATPKPTAFQHYLVQTASALNRLKHYSSKPVTETVVRGFKYYWHQNNVSVNDLRPLPGSANIDEHGHVKKSSTQHTQMRPVASGVEFTFRIHFENLNSEELGALCWVLQPVGAINDKEYCHSLGMGKPFGMGAVKLTAKLCLNDRQVRYRKLFSDAGDSWITGDQPESDGLSDYTTAFEKYILNSLGVYQSGSCEHLYQLERIATLLKMMEFPGYKARKDEPLFLTRENPPNTRYMTIDNQEYRTRPVLPAPLDFDQQRPIYICNKQPQQNWTASSRAKTHVNPRQFLNQTEVLEQRKEKPPETLLYEKGIIISEPKKFKAKVQNADNAEETFPCKDISNSFKIGDEIFVDVKRDKYGEVATATCKGKTK